MKTSQEYIGRHRAKDAETNASDAETDAIKSLSNGLPSSLRAEQQAYSALSSDDIDTVPVIEEHDHEPSTETRASLARIVLARLLHMLGKSRHESESMVTSARPHSEATDTIAEPIPSIDRPLTHGERIQYASTAHEAFREILEGTGDARAEIEDIDLALRHFDAEDFTDEERFALSHVLVVDAGEVIDKTDHLEESGEKRRDFKDLFTLVEAVDAIAELRKEKSTEDTGPILIGLVDVVDDMSDPARNKEKSRKFTTEEAEAIKDAIREYKGLTAPHRESLMYLVSQGLNEIADVHLNESMQKDAKPKDRRTPDQIVRDTRKHYRALLMKHRAEVGVTSPDVTGMMPPVEVEEDKAA